jgi:hypothetical protein
MTKSTTTARPTEEIDCSSSKQARKASGYLVAMGKASNILYEIGALARRAGQCLK